MKLISRIEQFYNLFVSFLLLTLSANKARAQLGINNPLYGVTPSPITSIANLVITILGLVGIVIIPLIGLRWILHRGKIKRLVYVLIVIIIAILIIDGLCKTGIVVQP